MAVTVTITVEDLRERKGHGLVSRGSEFRIKKLVNTIEFSIGQFLNAESVQQLINRIDHKVVIVEWKR